MADKKIQLIVGLDLSFTSTGITIIKCENNEAVSIEFHRVVFETVPRPIENINQHTYNLPANINTDDLVCAVDDSNENYNDFYSKDQALITLKGIITAQRIIKIIENKINNCDGVVDSLIINIEGFIMPDLAGSQQLRIIGGLIMLQGLVRSDLIKFKVGNPNIENFKLYITSPSALKSYFTGNGNADKELMLKSFIEDYDGSKLLPDTTSLKKVNDVVDSFALAYNAFQRYYYSWEPKQKIKKPKKKKEKSVKLKDGTVVTQREYLSQADKEQSVDLLMNSIPNS